jgi:hypothetical protein
MHVHCFNTGVKNQSVKMLWELMGKLEFEPGIMTRGSTNFLWYVSSTCLYKGVFLFLGDALYSI